MVILEEDPAKLPKELQHFKDREVRWLWWRIVREGHQIPAEGSLRPSELIRSLTHYLMSAPNPPKLIEQVLQAQKDDLVSDESLAWIEKGDQRLLIWLFANPVMRLANPAAAVGSPAFGLDDVAPEKRRSEFIFRLDMMTGTLAEKSDYLKRLRSTWSTAKTSDRLTKWLNQKNVAQIQWAWEYLQKHGKTAQLPLPVTDDERYCSVLAALDLLREFHEAARELFIEKMKKTWSQKKYRDSGKAKKPYHLPLTVRANSQLDWLAKCVGKSRSDVLIRLIDEEYGRAQGNQPQPVEGFSTRD